ncbi:bifunctional rhamnulose-1-phosphate aldolase/short-chain dehydrogenase, partial [Algoriphagus lutimaris]|nr:bifunctional rhamnulose-1-phosphate aldolase/short-chain dehydrogenase [Algoriphagus lutimaris]
LGGHGLFTWGDTSFECYINSLEVIETASAYLEANYGKDRPVFGGQKVTSLPAEQRASQAALLAPVLRGLASSEKKMVGTFSDTEVVLEF